MRNGKAPLHLWGRWSPADYLGDELVRLFASRGNAAALAVYFHVLQASRQAGGDLPGDIEGLAAVLGMPRKLVARGLAPWVNAGKLHIEGGRVFHPRVRREVEHDLAFREAAVISGSRGGQGSASVRSKGTIQGTLQGTVKAPSSYPEPVPVPSPEPVPEPVPEPDNGLPVAAQPAAPQVVQEQQESAGAAGIGRSITALVPEVVVMVPAKRAPAKPRETTWLTPYCESWQERWGQESTPPIGEMLREISKAEKALKGDRMECVARWRRFLAAAERSEWARPGRFAEGLGQWGPKMLAGMTGRKTTLEERTMAAARKFMERLTEEDECQDKSRTPSSSD